MKKSTIFYLIILLLACNQPSTNNSTNDNSDKTEELISDIKNKFGEINQKITSYKKMEKEITGESSEGGVLESYYQNEDLKKVVASYFGEMGKLVEEYYFDENTLFFVLTQSYSYDKPMHVEGSKVEKIDENSYYFHQNKLVSWLNPNKEKVAQSKLNQKESEILQKVKVLHGKLGGRKLVYSWVDKLNIRGQASTKGNVIASVDSDEALELTETKSEKMGTIVLRGVAYQDYWYKVRTSDGKEGWVFGGAVKQKNEQKGNAVLTKEKFDFPHFGAFDLSDWKNMKSDKFGGGDVEGSTKFYQQGDRILEITESDMGDYGYGYSQKLMDSNKKTLKERDFRFSPSEEYNGKNKLVEEVKDFTQNPPKKYSRVQEINVSSYALKPKPVMALGSWKKESFDASMVNGSFKDMKSLFRLSPISIFKETSLDLNSAEKEVLLQKGKSTSWEIIDESKSKLVIKAKENNDAVKLYFLKNRKNTDGMLATEITNGKTSKIQLWKYFSKNNSLEKSNDLKKYTANDFVSKADKLPDSYEPVLHYQFIDDQTIEVSLYTWMDKHFENREIINRIFLKWNGEKFEEKIVKIEK